MKINCLVFVAIQYFLYACPGTANEIDPRIINGQPGNLDEINFQVSVQYSINADATYVHICGGAVINLKTVITAAQCVYDSNSKLILATNIRVISGTVSPHLNNSGHVRYVSNIVPHPSYNTISFDSDVAVLKLSIAFQESTTLRPIDMNTQSISDGTNCVISGYGANQGNLTRANVLIMNLSLCKSLFQSDAVTDNMICAGGTGSNICIGDGGGPLVCNGKMVGIASFTASGCNSALPGVYTDVSKFADWVINNGASPSTVSVLTITFATLMAYLL